VDEVFNVGLAKDVFLAGDGRTRTWNRNNEWLLREQPSQ
jgi:hypothetical protein